MTPEVPFIFYNQIEACQDAAFFLYLTSLKFVFFNINACHFVVSNSSSSLVIDLCNLRYVVTT